jgi:hypothetical protein
MSDNLRDRIAAVLFQQRGYRHGWDDETEACREMWRRDADAVIAELGLREDTEVISAGWIGGDKTRTRHVTEWTNDD